jgi:hypothetical protein
VTARLGPRVVRGGKTGRVGSYFSYKGTRLAVQVVEDRAEADSIELSPTRLRTGDRGYG